MVCAILPSMGGAGGHPGWVKSGTAAHAATLALRPRPTSKEERMSSLELLSEVAPTPIWGDSVIVRGIHGDRLTLGVVELAPNAVVPEHRHDNEQLGLLIQG